MKKFFSLFLSFVMTVSVFACANFNAYASQSITVKFEQSDARTVLSKINALRTGSDAWYWNEDNTTKKYVTDAKPLTYDYTLEKIAMQRACELYFLYEHKRPDGSSVFTTYDQYGYASMGKGENIAYGYPDLTAAEVHEGWSEANCNYSGQGHRRTMLDSRFTAVGIAHISYYDASKGYNVHYWVEEFGTTVYDTTATSANNNTATVTLGNDNKVSISGLQPTAVTTTSPAPIATTSSSSSTSAVPTNKPTTSSTAVISTTIASATSTTTLAKASKPKKTSIKKLKKGKKSITVTWKKVKDVKGYQIKVATDKKFKKNVKSAYVGKQSKTKATVKKLKAKKKYFVKVRTYKIVNKKKVFSSWSKVKTIKTK